MDKPKLNIDALEITSFETTSIDYASPEILRPITDPTAATRCFICPPITADCA